MGFEAVPVDLQGWKGEETSVPALSLPFRPAENYLAQRGFLTRNNTKPPFPAQHLGRSHSGSPQVPGPDCAVVQLCPKAAGSGIQGKKVAKIKFCDLQVLSSDGESGSSLPVQTGELLQQSLCNKNFTCKFLVNWMRKKTLTLEFCSQQNITAAQL